MSRKTILCIVLGFTIASSLPAAGQDAIEGVSSVTLEEAYCDFALNPATGGVAGIDPVNNTVTLYPASFISGEDTTVVGPVTVGNLPTSIIFKQYKDKTYFAVACSKDNSVYILDAETLELVKHIRLGRDEVSCLSSATDIEDPYVYYAFGRGHESSPGRVTMTDFTDDGVVMLSGRNDNAMDLAISADGMLIYLRGPWSPSGFGGCRRVRDPATGEDQWVDFFYDHDSVALYVPDPFTHYTAVGRAIYAAELAEKVATMDFVVTSFFPDRPVIVGLDDDNRLRAASYNTFWNFGSVTISALGEFDSTDIPGMAGRQSDFKRYRYEPRCLTDATSDRVIVAYGDQMTVVPLEALGVTDEPLLLVKGNVPARATVGEELSVDFTPYGGDVELALSDGPPGMTLTDGSLAWTPTASDVGEVAFEVTVSAGEDECRQVFELTVTQPLVQLTFRPDAVAISPSGKLAIVWTRGAPANPYTMESSGDDRSHIALIDVEQREVLVERRLLYSITTAAVDDQVVYVAPSKSDRLDTLALTDLSSDKRVNTDGTIIGIRFISPSILAATTEGGLLFYSVPELERMDVPGLESAGEGLNEHERYERMMMERMAYGHDGYDGYDETRGLVRCRDGWAIGGYVFAPDLSRIKAIVNYRGLPSHPASHSDTMMTPTLWNRVMQAGTLIARPDHRVVTLETSRCIILDDLPALAGVRLPDGRQSVAAVDIIEMVTGDTVASIRLGEGAVDPDDYYGGHYSDEYYDWWGLASAGRTILTLVDRELYVIKLDDATVEQLTEPLVLEVLNEVPRVGVTDPVEIAHTARGGEGPLEFDLQSTFEGVEIDQATGTVTLHGDVLAESAAGAIVEGFLSGQGHVYSESSDPAEVLADYTAQAKASFKKLLGEEPAGFPVLIPLSVVVVDANGQLAQLDYKAILEVPEDMLAGPVAEAIAAAKAEREAQEQRYEEQYRQVEAAPRSRGQADDDRVEALEQRVADLEAKIELLITLLQERTETSE